MAELIKADVLSQINAGVESVRAWARRSRIDVLVWDVENVDILPVPADTVPGQPQPGEDGVSDKTKAPKK